MTVLATFAYGFIAFGPIAALFIVTVARKAYEIIIVMSSAFFWLMSLLLSSIIWAIVPPLYDTPAFTLPFSVLLQEFFRWVCYRLIRRVDKLLEVLSEDKSPRRKHKVAYVAGMGFGIIAGVVAFANVLRASGGPGVVGVVNRGSQYFILSSAFGANIMIMLQICWGVIYFDGWETLYRSGFTTLNKNTLHGYFNVVLVIVSHLAVSLLSLLNQSLPPTYFLVVSYAVAFLLIGYSLHLAGARITTLKHFFAITDSCDKQTYPS